MKTKMKTSQAQRNLKAMQIVPCVCGKGYGVGLLGYYEHVGDSDKRCLPCSLSLPLYLVLLYLPKPS